MDDFDMFLTPEEVYGDDRMIHCLNCGKLIPVGAEMCNELCYCEHEGDADGVLGIMWRDAE